MGLTLKRPWEPAWNRAWNLIAGGLSGVFVDPLIDGA
jgi:hypothetical protein